MQVARNLLSPDGGKLNLNEFANMQQVEQVQQQQPGGMKPQAHRRHNYNSFIQIDSSAGNETLERQWLPPKNPFENCCCLFALILPLSFSLCVSLSFSLGFFSAAAADMINSL